MTRWSGRQVTGALAMLGAVVAAVGNALAPRINGDDVVVYHKIAASTRFAAAGVIVLAAVVIVTAAFVGLTRIRSIGGDTELASYGRLAAVAGGAIAVLQTGVELYAYRQQAKAFDGANAHNVVSAFWATNALDHTSSALFATWTLVLLGAAPALIGVAQLRSRTTGRLGVAAIVGGAVCCVVGVASLLTADQSTYDVPFGVGSAIVTIWLFVTGLVIWLRGEDREINIAEQSTRQTQARVAAG